MKTPSSLVHALKSNWLMMHVSMMMISYATLIVGSLFSLLYLAFVYVNKGQKQLSIEISGNSNSTGSSLSNSSKLSLLEIMQEHSSKIKITQ